MRTNQWRQGLILGVLLLVALGLVSLIWGLGGKMQVAVTEAHNAERQYQSLEARKAALEGNLASLATARGQEGAIRTSFGVARPGEEVIVVVPPETPTTTPAVSWWQRVLNWF